MKTQNKVLLMSLILLGFFTTFPSSAFCAGLGLWTCVCSTATVDESSLQNFEFFGSQFRFREGKRGSIFARCNVTNPEDYAYCSPPLRIGCDPTAMPESSPQWKLLEVVYRDPDGEGLSAGVRARLFRVSNATGASSQIAEFNSNTAPSIVTQDAQTNGVFFDHIFDFFANAYYVLLEVNRTIADPLNDPAVFYSPSCS
jgi:hypothetical protein